jgi:hypothetical protein
MDMTTIGALLGRLLGELALAFSSVAIWLRETADALAPAQDQSAQFQKTSVLVSPNVRTEADFIKAYRLALEGLMVDIRRYVRAQGFDERRYDDVLRAAHQLAVRRGVITPNAVEVLAILWHKEIRFGDQAKDYKVVLAESSNRTKSAVGT